MTRHPSRSGAPGELAGRRPAGRRSLHFAVALLAISVSAAAAPKSVDILITGGTVITMAGPNIDDGSVAIDNGEIVAVGTVRGDRSSDSTAKTTINARGMAVAPRLRQHAHARADDALPRHRRRPRSHGLAAALHLPGRGEERRPRLREVGNAAGRGGDDPLRARRRSPTCTTSRATSPREAKAAGLRGVLGETFIDFPVAGQQDVGRRRRVHARLRQAMEGRSA